MGNYIRNPEPYKVYLVAMLRCWRYSGFQVYAGLRIQLGEEKGMENLARYLIRASFSQHRMIYLPEESNVRYESKDGREEMVFLALEWLAAMGFHVPDKTTLVQIGFLKTLYFGQHNEDGTLINPIMPLNTLSLGLLRAYKQSFDAFILDSKMNA